MSFFKLQPTVSGYLRKRRRTLHEACSRWSSRKGLESTPCDGCQVRDYCEANRDLPAPLASFATLRKVAAPVLAARRTRQETTSS